VNWSKEFGNGAGSTRSGPTEHGRSIPQVVLRWLIQQGNVAALSRTTNPHRIRKNLAIFDFELNEDVGNDQPASAFVTYGGQ
jgi:aryl-alcohol dehydrogenase-like predicted oxidoreductase